MALTYQAAVEQTITAGEQIHQIVNGTATTEVTVEDGSKVPSVRKALLDNFYFKDPIAWQVGQTENVFNQLRQFTDGSWWYAPSATASNPISMGSTPVGDPLWKIYDFDAIGKLTPQLRESLRRSYAEAGYNLVDGSFEAGGTLVNANDVLLQESTGKAFSGPVGTVVAETDPASGGFVDKSGGLLRHELATSNGATKVGTSDGGSVQDFIDAQYTTVAELATGRFQVGQYVRLTDRAMGLFLVQSGGTADGYGVLDAGNGNTAMLNTFFIDGEVNVLWFGAKADAFLSDAITINSSRTDNHGAMQAAVTYAESKGINGVYVPSNRLGYYSSAPIRTKRETAQFTTTVTTGITIRGDGKDSILVGTGADPATYVSGVNVGNDCILAIHCSNAIVKELQFRDTPVGVFFGHDPRTGSTDRSYVCLNNLKDCWFYRTGTGVVHTPSRDAHFYNRFNNLQFQDFQIAIHQSLPVDNSTSTAVANRNFYETIKMNNGWAGFVLENGDTGVIESCNFESINGVETVPGVRGAVGTIPSQIHDGAATATAIHINNDAHPYGVDNWKVSNCHAEANSRDMYHDGRGWGIINSEFNLDKIALGSNKLAGTYQSNNPHTTNGQYASFNYGGYFGVKTRIGLDPFFPGTGETASDRGAYVNGFLYDLTGAPKNYDFAAACPQITALTSGNTKYSVLSKRVHWSGTVVFPQPSGSTLNVTLPDTAQVDNTAMGGVIVPLYVKGAAGVELTKATYLVSNNKVQIAPPPGGWAATGNEIYVNLTWKKN